MKVHIYHLIEGAKAAKGLTVIIDVFRAFSLECYLYDFGAKEVRPAGSLSETLAFRETLPGCLLVGERNGEKVEGFDFGNSPSTVIPEAVKGKTIIHTTSAGTQGVVNAVNASEILTGSLVNAKAIAAYIREKDPEEVSLVAMGAAGIYGAEEDELCADYIKSLLLGEPLPDFEARLKDLQFHGGEHFFNPAKAHIFPTDDFYMCIDHDRFPFVLRIEKDAYGFISRKIPVKTD